jgi:hypothetical protein
MTHLPFLRSSTLLNNAQVLKVFDIGGMNLVYRNHETLVYLAARTHKLTLEKFYKAGNEKVIKCRRKKLQIYDIYEGI